MYRPEIEAILGPPTDDSTGPLLDQTQADCFVGQPIRVTDRAEDWIEFGTASPNVDVDNAVWCNDRLVCVVTFDRDGKAWLVSVRHTSRSPQGSLDNLLWRAKRLWRRWFDK
jgi:hypothetical protein